MRLLLLPILALFCASAYASNWIELTHNTFTNTAGVVIHTSTLVDMDSVQKTKTTTSLLIALSVDHKGDIAPFAGIRKVIVGNKVVGRVDIDCGTDMIKLVHVTGYNGDNVVIDVDHTFGWVRIPHDSGTLFGDAGDFVCKKYQMIPENQ